MLLNIHLRPPTGAGIELLIAANRCGTRLAGGWLQHRTTNEGAQEMSRMKTAGLVGLLMIGLVGCDGSQDIVSPNYEQDIVAMESSDCKRSRACVPTRVSVTAASCGRAAFMQSTN
jgi:hypothetical protein